MTYKNIKHDITEKEIFDYVFHDEKLSASTLNIIKNDPRLQNLAAYYESLKKLTLEDDDIDDRVLNKLAEKIPLFKPAEEIELLPLPEDIYVDSFIKMNKNHLEYPETDTITFSDNSYKYFIRVKNADDKTYLQTFSSVKKLMTDLHITILPTGYIIKQKDNNMPAVIDRTNDIRKILLKLGKSG